MLRIAVFLAAVVCASAAELIPLRYDPPEGVITKRTVTRTREMRRGGKETVDVNFSQSERRAEKTDSGFDLHVKILKTALERNGQPIASPMLTAMEGLELTYKIDEEGQIGDIQGYDGILDKLKQTLPAPFVQQLTALFNREGLRRRDMAEWNESVGRFAGKTVELGEVWANAEPYGLPAGGTATLYAVAVFDDWTDCADARCLRIRYRYDTNPLRLVNEIGEKARQPLEAAGWDGASLGSDQAEIVGEGQKIFYPATLEIYSETAEKRLSMTAADSESGDATRIELKDSTDYEFKRRPVGPVGP